MNEQPARAGVGAVAQLGVDDTAFGEAARELADLRARVEAARLLLATLEHDLARATPAPRADGDAGLCEANEHLLLAALEAQERQAAAESMQARQAHFLALLAHELRNPLTVIRAASGLLGRVHSAEPRLPRMRAIIDQQVVHMTRFVSDLLDVARVSTGKLRLERVEMDLAGVLADVVEACRPAMDARLQCFTVEVPAGPLMLEGDAVRLTQVFNNLLDNASKYTPNGGGVRLSLALRAGTAKVTVCDTGIGITAEALPDVFEPFVQDAHAVGFNGAGLGLGLTVVRELVEGHGGTVAVSSAGKGLGSCFVVTLPLARGQGEVGVSRPTRTEPSAKPS